MLSAALLGLLLLSVPQDEAAAPRTFALRPVRLERLPTSPRRTLRPSQPLADGLEVAGARFAASVEDGVARIASRPGGDPTRRVRNGTVLALGPGAPNDDPEVELLFERRLGAWLWGAANARRFELGDLELCLVDVDADGAFDLLHDGWSLGVGGPLMPLAEVLLLDDRELRIQRLAQDGSELVAVENPLAGSPVQRAALARLNRLRLGEGLAAVRIETGLSEGCSLHADYLARRAWDGTGDGRDQDAGAADATRAGLAAARKSEVLALAPAAAIDELWRGLDGRLLLSDPDLATVGISASEGQVAVIDVRSRPTRREGAAVTYRDIRLSPADGSFGRPARHAVNGDATPVEKAAQAGPPLLLLLARGSSGLDGYELELFTDSGNRRRVPTIPLPRSADRPGLLGGLPKRPLEPGRAYLAVHRLTVDGEVRVFEVRFTTAEGQ